MKQQLAMILLLNIKQSMFWTKRKKEMNDKLSLFLFSLWLPGKEDYRCKQIVTSLPRESIFFLEILQI